MNNFKFFLLMVGLFAYQNISAQTDSTFEKSKKTTIVNSNSSHGRMDSLTNHMINEPAPLFTLKDLNGKTVSLMDLRGKIVVIDFWATWCPPCKASMPAFQAAINQYKKRSDVKFLFIDCGERVANYKDSVKKFIKENNYNFHVLLDEKGEDGYQTKVLNSYHIDGIPTKFIVDKQGKIRFKSVGYSGNPEALIDELNTMIKLVRKNEK